MCQRRSKMEGAWNQDVKRRGEGVNLIEIMLLEASLDSVFQLVFSEQSLLRLGYLERHFLHPDMMPVTHASGIAYDNPLKIPSWVTALSILC